MNAKLGFRLIDRDWKGQLQLASRLQTDEILIVAPFIKYRIVKWLTAGKKRIRVLTRFSLADFAEGVSDLSAVRHLLNMGAEVRGIRNLHAKLYVFGSLRGIVTSANLTEAALTRNHELGFITDDSDVIRSCRGYFDHLWQLAGSQVRLLTIPTLEQWENQIRLAVGRQEPYLPGLRDYGADLGLMPDPPKPTFEPAVSAPAFVKFFGTSDERDDRMTPTIEEVEESESHWSLSYPKGKRPRQVPTRAVMFIGHMVHSPNDTLIYGRATAYEHQPGRDDASAADIKRQAWKSKWSTFLRVRDPEFIAGTLSNGISLSEMMRELGPRSFLSTETNQRAGVGNTDPRIALRSKAHMPLTQTAAEWLNSKFYQAIAEHGRIPISELEKLYWPELPPT